MFCSNCGEELSEDTIFCSNCGKRVSAEPVRSRVSSILRPRRESVNSIDELEAQLTSRINNSLQNTTEEVVTEEITPTTEIQDQGDLNDLENDGIDDSESYPGRQESFCFIFKKPLGLPDNKMAQDAKDWIRKVHPSWEAEYGLVLEVDGNVLSVDYNEWPDGWDSDGSSYSPSLLAKQLTDHFKPYSMIGTASSYHADIDGFEDLWRIVSEAGMMEVHHYSAFYSSSIENYAGVENGEVDFDYGYGVVIDSQTFKTIPITVYYTNEGERVKEQGELGVIFTDNDVFRLAYYSEELDTIMDFVDENGNYVLDTNGAKLVCEYDFVENIRFSLN